MDFLKLMKLKAEKRGLELQLAQLQISTKTITPDNLNKIAKVTFELSNVAYKIDQLNKNK